MQRRQLDSPSRSADELEFLPAALSIQETPTHPWPHVVIRLIITFFVIALLWAAIGQIDIVATAEGKIVPVDRVKLIQPVDTAVVQAINVVDGQRVEAGDVVIELDPTEFIANAKRVEQELDSAKFEIARAEALLFALDNGDRLPQLENFADNSSSIRFEHEASALNGQFSEYLAQKQQLKDIIGTRVAQRATVKKTIDKLEALLPIIEERARNYQRLVEMSYVARHASMDRRQELITTQNDLYVQRARQDEIAMELLEAQSQLSSLNAKWRRTWLDERIRAENIKASLEQELVKANQRIALTKLRAPISGTVQQLSIHTVGGVATEAQPLMVIVPADGKIEVEAFVQNKDIGFVYSGQRAEVKVQAFPFTKYGKISGQVVDISEDAIEKEGLGLVYAARVQLEQTHVLVGNKKIALSPGMVVTSEISTGMRRIIEYFLSPLLRYQDESLTER
jgi:hemolysin D